MIISNRLKANILAIGCLLFSPKVIQAQVSSDNTTNTVVDRNGNTAEITGGQTRGGNLFHSFQDFSVPEGNTASFENAEAIENIFSRVTGGNISNIDGVIRANGSASLFLINPAGIIFGENARLDVGGSFLGSTADSILFPDGVEFSASDPLAQPILTINAPIGLGFRDNPGDLVNRANSFDDRGTPNNPADDFAIGLRVGDNQTIGLIGGNVLFDGGFATARGGRIEVGSVGANSTVSFTPIESGWDIGYEGVTNFQDINLVAFSRIGSFSEGVEVTENVQVVGRNITLTQGSQIGVFSEVGQAGNVFVRASESIAINGNGIEVNSFGLPSGIFNVINNEASGENSKLTIATPVLSLSNGGVINAANTDSTGQGVDIAIAASEISLDGAIDFDVGTFVPTGIFAQTFLEGIGDGGNITIKTVELMANNGAQISTETRGSGNAGNLIINASESIEFIGTATDVPVPSSLLASVRETANASEGGDIEINTPRLIVRDGAQIASVTRSQAKGGNITINASESISLSGIAATAELDASRTGITVSTAPSSVEPNPATGDAGILNINTRELNIERGAFINASTSSIGDAGNATINVNRLTITDGGQIRAGSFLGNNFTDNRRGEGGSLNITATDSVSIIGTVNINGESATSSISTIAEGTGNAGSVSLSTNELTVRDGAEIDASATGNEAAGNLKIEATTANLDRGSIRAITSRGEGGNIILDIDENLTLSNESQISTRALGDANGGNIDINSNFIVAFPSQPDGSDIVANAEQGTGGRIDITARSLFGIDRGKAVEGNGTNNIDASSDFGLDGNVTIRVLDVEPIQEMTELPENLTNGEQTTTQACQSGSLDRANTLTVRGKGGIARQPVESLNSEIITIGSNEDVEPQQSQASQIQSFQTSQGKIVPAQGVVVSKDGKVTLTSYQTGEKASRNSNGLSNCV